MCKRIFSIKELGENDEEWCRPSSTIQTKANISATKKELLARIYKLEIKNQALQERIQKLEQQKNWLAKKCEDLSEDPEDLFMPYSVPAKEWMKRAEQAIKE